MEDKRIIKTKKAIYQALKELYLENDFEDISITQLTEKANIGRKTFYLHYSSIDDIVDEISTTYDIVPSLATLHGIDTAIDDAGINY